MGKIKKLVIARICDSGFVAIKKIRTKMKNTNKAEVSQMRNRGF
ncbi:hypothetical protein [Helicobacter sp. T3_23-1059]